MPEVRLPAFPDSLATAVVEIEAEHSAYISPEQFATLGTSFPGGVDGRHAEFREPVTIGGQEAELSGVLGIHNNVGEAGAGRPWVHYNVRLRRRRTRASTQNEEGWTQLCDAILRVLGSHSAKVVVSLEIPTDSATPAVSLPIKLSPSEVTGFSEIRGVRLVQVDPAKPESSLYSAIVQQSSSSVSVHAISAAEINSRPEMLNVAWASGLAVARLAVPSIERT